MQKISPLRSSIEAINKLKAFKSNTADKIQNSAHATNPFGLSFKGTVVQMDVFEKAKKANNTPSLKENLVQIWNNTAEKFSSIKDNTVAFSGKVKENALIAGKKIQDFANQKVEFNFFKYNVSNLQKRPVSELKAMLSTELKGI